VAADLYAYLDRYPERAPTCFASLLDEVPEGDALSDEETELTKAVDAAMGACGRVLEPMEDEPYTIDELSRLVYDPFPAPLRLVVSGKVLEREGFPGGAEGPLQVPAASLWSAFVSLEGRWLEPDPALALWRENAASGRKTIDVTGIASLSRHFARPKPDDVRAAIEGQLRQPPVYRVRWEASEDEVPALPFDDAP
jgi:hypothetical protein